MLRALMVTVPPGGPGGTPPARLDSESLPSLTRAARALGLLGVEAASIGLMMWILCSREGLPGYVQDNDLEAGQRRFVLIDMAVAIGLAAIVAGALFVWRRRACLPILERLT